MASEDLSKNPKKTPEEEMKKVDDITRRDACKLIGGLAAMFGASIVGCGRAVMGPEGCDAAGGPEGCNTGPGETDAEPRETDAGPGRTDVGAEGCDAR